MPGPAVRCRDHERDVDRLLPTKRPGRWHIGREQGRAVRGSDVEDADYGGERAPGQGSAGEGLGQVVRLRDRAVGAVEECGLPNGGEGERWDWHGMVPTGSYADNLRGDW